jgi:hypothetical protein
MTVRGRTMGAVAAVIAEQIVAVIAVAVVVGDAEAADASAGDARRVAPAEGTYHPPNMPRRRAANPEATIIAPGSAAGTKIAARKRRAVRDLPPRFPLRKKFFFPANHLRSIAADR